MKAVAFILTLGLVLAGYYIWQQEIAIRDLRAAAQSKTQPAPPQTASVEQQKVCADQAKKDFVDAGWHLNGDAVNGTTASYTNHYATRLNKCFIQIYMIGGSPNVAQDYLIADAFEQREYAHYDVLYEKTDPKKIIFMQCDVTLPNQPTFQCHSKDEWDDLTIVLMGGN